MKKIFYETTLKDLSFGVSRGLSSLPHLHEHIEIIYVEDGRAIAFAGKKSYEIENGKAFITFPNQVHYYENSVIGRYHVIIVSANLFLEEKKFFFENEPISNVITDNDEKILKLVKNLYTAEGSCKGLKEVGTLNQMILSILENIELKPQVKSENYTLPRILSYCRENCSKDITLDMVAGELGLSKYHISHLLNQRLGIGFSSYINHLRIDRACKMLRDTEKNISEIAFDVGFGSIRSFNRAFRDIIDATPVKYKASLVTATEGEGKIQSKDY